MTYTATITSKRQLTLPAALFETLKLEAGQKISIEVFDDHIRMQTIEQQLAKMRGSVKIPERFKGLTEDEIIAKAKEEYFEEKYKDGIY